MNTDKLYAEQLANEYAPKNTSRVVALRKLDAKAKLPATAFTYAFGITSALIFGTGLCLAMGQIGSGTTGSFVLGILMGVVGMAPRGSDMLRCGFSPWRSTIWCLADCGATWSSATAAVTRNWNADAIIRLCVHPPFWTASMCPPGIGNTSWRFISAG